MKYVLAAVRLQSEDPLVFARELEELENLANGLGDEIVARTIQVSRSLDPSTAFRSGKVTEIKELRAASSSDAVLLNDELSPRIEEALTREIGCPIVDRTALILKTFAARSRSKEAILQVELARQAYELPRIAHAHVEGTRSGGGIGAKGAGESETALARDRAQKAIVRLKRELASLTLVRKEGRKSRGEHAFTVALAGYTNAGKSSLLDALIGMSQGVKSKPVVAENRLFSTLETATRAISIPPLSFLVTDTVGFLQKLPHSLIEAFKSTLEEISEADLIVIVADASDPFCEREIATTEEVLASLGAASIPRIHCFNKIDLVTGTYFLPPRHDPAVRTSAKTGLGLPDLVKEIARAMESTLVPWEGLLPFDSPELARMKTLGIVKSIRGTEEGYLVSALVPPSLQSRLISLSMETK